nr:hepatic lectin-like [Pogona vitticeps]
MASGTTDRYLFLDKLKSSSFLVGLLLAFSYLLVIILFGLVLSHGSRVSTEVKTLHERSKIGEDLFPCGARNREWKYFHGGCYYFAIEQVIWDTAKTHCEEKNSSLVVIQDKSEQNFLQSRTRGGRYWIGLHDKDTEGEWRWIDGTNYRTNFKNWKQGQPTDYASNEDCAEINIVGEWNDENCNTQNFYVCEKPLPS